MKFFNQFTGFSALLLAGTMGFAACSSDDEVADVNPSYDGSSVKAQFAINIPANTTQSRMTSGKAQEGGVFLGMQDIKLIPMTLSGEETAADKDLHAQDLSNITKTGLNSWNNSTIHAKMYTDVEMALGVNHAVFYGAAIYESEADETGLKYNSGTKVGDITFNLVSPYISTEVTNIQNYLLGIINGVDGVLTAGASTSAGVQTLQEVYRGLYATSQYRVIAGSSAKILAMLQDLYNSCEKGKADDSAHATEYENVMTKIDDYFIVEGTADNRTLTYDTTVSGYVTNANNYPACAKIPQGAVAIQFNRTATAFAYTTSDINAGSNFNMTHVDNYRKPASLNYFVETPIRTLGSEWLANNLTGITSAQGWDGVLDAYDAANGGDTKVTSSTRSMILEKPVQYGVADLEAKVIASGATLKDESGAVKTIGDKLKITGILIGGQKDVAWNFKPAGATEYVVYDGKFAGSSAVLGTDLEHAAKNHTLLLETPTATNVKVAIEFENNMEDFYGMDHMLISKGTKFYLIADLKPGTATGTGNQTDNGTTATSVFQQDYKTTARFTVSSLKNAYSVVPDLRSPKLEFGLSVDLDWKTGMDFIVNVE